MLYQNLKMAASVSGRAWLWAPLPSPPRRLKVDTPFRSRAISSAYRRFEKMGWSPEEVAAAREATPGTRNVIHLNNAGCSLPTQSTLDTVVDYLTREALHGGYETFDASADALDMPYTALASLLNCDPQEIAITTSATESWQQVIYGLAWTWRAGDAVLTSLCEYGSNYIAYLQLQRRTGIDIKVIPETPAGDLDLAALERLLTTFPVVLVALNHIPTSSGRVYDVQGVGALTRAAGVLFLLDACQSVGQLPLDVKSIQCDFLSGTGRKYLRAPRGSGFLYAARSAWGLLEPATLDNTGAAWTGTEIYSLRDSARRFERYEMSFAAKAGLGVAVNQLLDVGVARTWARIQVLAAALREGLAHIEGVSVQDKGATLCGIVSFTVNGHCADEVQQGLAAQGINVSVSRTPSSRLDFEARGLEAVVRASVHVYNTENEVATAVAAVAEIAAAGESQTGS